LRYQWSANLSPFVFYDIGYSRLENNPTTLGKNSRSLSGFGIGLRFQSGPINLEAMLANPLVGGDAQADPRDNSPTAWLMLRYAF
jgi:hemolysin activation/secretion protein